jgi:putative ABC transport system permease protein
MGVLAQDLRFAFRQLKTAPGFTTTVVLTLAVGIGATTAVFSLVEGVLLRSLPFSHPARLVLLGDHLANGPGISVTAREIDTYAKATSAFSAVGGYIPTSYELSGGTIPEEIAAARLNSGVFPTLGVLPTLGRVFTQEEENAHQPVAVISDALWRNRYHQDSGVLGRPLVLDRKVYSIIGVMPRGFEFPLEAGHLDQAQVWVPMSLSADELSEPHMGFWGYGLVARLKDDVTLAQAATDADRVSRQIMLSFPASMSAIRIKGDVRLLREFDVAEVRPVLQTLFMAVSVVLLIACVNIAGLLLVRAIRRRREFAVRLALGARSGAIVRQSVFEGLSISIAGGLLGLGFAAIAVRASLYLLPDSMPRIDSISIDGGVAAFALVVAIITGTLCSLAPAFAALRTNLTENLKEGARTGTTGSSHTRLRSALVVSEIAIALVLITVSGAFLRSFQKMRAVDLGFRADHVLVAQYQLPLQQYATSGSADSFNHAVFERLSNQPGVIAVGSTNALPASGTYGRAAYTIDGEPVASWKLKFAMFGTVYGDYFRAMGIKLLDGRFFTTDDRPTSALVIIVNQSMARHCWPGERAVGKRMHVGNPHKGYPWATVVGVVADVKMGSGDEPSQDQWYSPAEQPATLNGSDFLGNLTSQAGGYIALRSSLPAEQMTQILRAAVSEVDPLLALQQVQPMEDAISNVEAPRRFNTTLITGFAAGALLLAITGIYAVVAFSVSLRTQELAIRIALGAQRKGIARLVLISAAKLALLGCGLGVLGSLSVSRLVSSFLFDVSATDPIIYGVGVLVMMIVALAASALPAIRAAQADPRYALRST